VIEGRDFAALSNGSRASRAGRGALLCSTLALACAACSPWSAAVGARDAQLALQEAERARAGEHAVYEYALAKLYLEKAREEAAEAHYAVALQLLQRSRDNAHAALLRAERAPRQTR
jgi:hypothetical protein